VGSKNKTKLNFKTSERENKKSGIKVSTLNCSKKGSLNCPFFLEFHINAKKLYLLNKYHNKHYHALEIYNLSSELTEKMLERLQDLKTTGSDAQIITKLINQEFSTNFHYKTIYYQLRKLTDNTLGEINDDAYNFVSMLEQGHKIRGGFYDIMKDDDGELLNCCYMTQRMYRMLESFSDAIIIDTSHKTNRFNLPLQIYLS